MIRTSHLTVAELYRIYGVNRAMVRHVLYSQFSISEDYKICMKYMRRLRVSGETFKNHMKDGQYYDWDGEKNIQYNIIYHDCTPAVAKRAKSLELSFRVAQEDFNIEPVVIVRLSRI